MTLDLRPRPRAVLGRLGLVLGLAAFLIVLAHGWAGPFAPRPEGAGTLAETAVEGLAFARRLLTGEGAGAAPPRWTVDRVLAAVAGGLAGLAVLSGLVGMARREPPVPALAGALLAAGAVALPVFGLFAA